MLPQKDRWELWRQAAEEMGFPFPGAGELRQVETAAAERDYPWRLRYSFADVASSWRPSPSELFVGMGIDREQGAFWVYRHDLADTFGQRPTLVGASDSEVGRILLKSIASGISYFHDARDIQFGVVTAYPDKWAKMTGDHCLGVFPAYANSAPDFLLSLTSWVHAKRGGGIVVLLVDGLEEIPEMNFEDRQNFRWLLRDSGKRGVVTIASLVSGAMSYQEFRAYDELFPQRILGPVQSLEQAHVLAGGRKVDTTGLTAGIEYKYFDGRYGDFPLFRIPSS